MLCTLHQADGQAGTCVETELGTPAARPAPARRHAQAVLVGGYHGAWLPAADAARLTLSNAELQPAGRVRRGRRAGGPARRTGAGSPRPRGSPGTWRWNRPGSAARASTACRASPPPWTKWPAHGPDPARGDRHRSAGQAWSRAAAPAITRTAPTRFVRSALHVFRDEIRTAPRRAGAWTRRRRPFLPLPADGWPLRRDAGLELTMREATAGGPDRLRRARPVRRAAARADHAGRVGLPDRGPAAGAPRRWTGTPGGP